MHTSVSTTKTKSTQKTNLETELLTGSKNISDHVQDFYHTLFQRHCCTTVLGVINVDTWLKSWGCFFSFFLSFFFCVLELGISLPSCKQNLLALKGKQEPWPSFDTGMTMLLVLKNKHTWQAVTVIAEILFLNNEHYSQQCHFPEAPSHNSQRYAGQIFARRERASAAYSWPKLRRMM